MNSVSACAINPDVAAGMNQNSILASGDSTAATADEARVLNDVALALLDNVDEYRRAVFGLEQLLGTLQCHLYNRVEALEQLQAHISRLGAQPVTHSALGTAFAALLAVPKLSARNDQEDLMQDVDRGERAVRKLLNKCLADKTLSNDSRECVSKTVSQLSADRCRPADIWSPKCELQYSPQSNPQCSISPLPTATASVS